MDAFVALATQNARNAVAEQSTRRTEGKVEYSATTSTSFPAYQNQKSREKFYVRSWWRKGQPLPCAKSRIFYGVWSELKSQIMLPCKPRYKGFRSIQEAAEHDHFKRMLPFEADETIRAMAGADKWTVPLSSEEKGENVVTHHFVSTPSSHVLPPSAINVVLSDAASVDSTAVVVPPSVRKRQRISLGGGFRDRSSFEDETSNRWRLDLPLESLQVPGGTIDDVPRTLFIATDGSALDMNGAFNACGGMGIAWQWGTKSYTLGSWQKPMPWNNGGATDPERNMLGLKHTNIAAEWRALVEAMSLVLFKFHSTMSAREHFHLRFFIDCKAVLTWINKFAATLPLPYEAKPVAVTETNFPYKSQASLLLAKHLAPNFASVTFHWVKAHRNDKMISKLTGAEKIAAILNRAADQAAHTAANMYRTTFCVHKKISNNFKVNLPTSVMM